MEQLDIPQIKRRKHKSDFLVFSKAEGRPIKPKRLSCMKASEYLKMEESKISIANQCIEDIILNVFDFINNAKLASQLCLKQVQKKVQLVQYFEFYNFGSLEQQDVPVIRLQQEPKNQQKHRVLINRKKPSQSCFIQNKNEITTSMNNSSNSKNLLKLPSKDKLNNTGSLSQNKTARSLKSIRSGRGSFVNLGSKKKQSILEEDQERSLEKQKRRKQEIIKKLLRQHQKKLQEVTHPCPQPLLEQYRSLFSKPQTLQEEDLRTSYLHRRQLRESQANLNNKNFSKFNLNKSDFVRNESKQNLSESIKLPLVYRPENGSKNKTDLYAQDQNGSIIKVKNGKKKDQPTRQYSLTLHESVNVMPQQSKLKEISSFANKKIETLNNPKIKPESLLLKQNASILSTYCQSVDQQLLERSLFQRFGNKDGVIYRKSEKQHKNSVSMQLQSLKLPSILLKKT